MRTTASLSRFLSICFAIFIFSATNYAQSGRYIFVANGGSFEFSPPYTDFVTVGFINPLGDYTEVETIHTQSVQQVITLNSNYLLLVAAQDSLVMYSIPIVAKNLATNTFSRYHAAALPDTYGSFHSICQGGGLIFAGEWYGSDANFLHIYDEYLNLQGSVAGIDRDVSSMVAIGDTLYIAQNIPTADFTSDSVGYISKVHIPTRTFVGSFGSTNPNFAGVNDLFNYNGTLLAVGRKQGALLLYTPTSGQLETRLPGSLGKAFYLADSKLVVKHQNIVQMYDIPANSWTDLSCLMPANETVVAAIPFDDSTPLVGATFFTTDFSSFGRAYQRTANCSYRTTNVGVSCEAAAAFTYSVATDNLKPNLHVSIQPNPASHFVRIDTKNNLPCKVKITDLIGRIWIQNDNLTAQDNLHIANLPSGTYVVTIENEQGRGVEKLTILR